MKRIPANGIQLREAAATELFQVLDLVRGALKSHLGLGSDQWISFEQAFPDRVVFTAPNGHRKQAAYTIDENNAVTIGEVVEVNIQSMPVKPTEAPAAAPIAESVFVESVTGSRSRFVVRVIKAGTSLNNRVYPAEVLRAAVPLFEGVRVRSLSDEQHIKDIKRIDTTIGQLIEAKWDEATQSIVAILDGLSTASIVPRIAEAIDKKMAHFFGLSINASGQVKRLPNGLVEAQKIIKVSTVDLVEQPGAGGAVISLVEAVDQESRMRQTIIAKLIEAGHNAASLTDLTDEQLLSKLTEAAPTSTTPPRSLDQSEIQRFIEASTARIYAKTAVHNAQLPKAAKDKLHAHLATLTNLTEAIVDTAIADEQKYLSSFLEAGKIDLPRIESGETQAQKTDKMLDDFFAGNIGSFRECYVQITGDKDVTGDLRRCDLARMAEATGQFREAISSTTFSNALGDSITRALQAEYSTNDLFSDWQYLVDETNVRDFRTQERAQIGGYGNLPTVAQAGAYTALSSPGDFKATYAATKRGGTETVTIESIANDDVGLLRRIPIELATAAGMTLYDFVYGFMSNNALIYDGVALFAGGHNNIGTAALSAAAFSAARLRLMNQLKPGSSKRMGLVARHLIVPPELEETAYDLFVRTSNNDETFVQSRKPTIHVCPSFTDTNNWYVTADKRQQALIEIGFYGSKTPELFVQDNPSVGSLFTNDQITYKIRHIYGGAVKDFRGLDGSVVA
jgi:hypothetical protein